MKNSEIMTLSLGEAAPYFLVYLYSRMYPPRGDIAPTGKANIRPYGAIPPLGCGVGGRPV